MIQKTLKTLLITIVVCYQLYAQNASNPFAGLWINERYVNEIRKSKSPYKAQQLARLSNISFSSSATQNNMIGWNFHEGESIILKKKGTQYEVWHTEPVHKLGNLSILTTNQKIKVGKDTFLKLKTRDNTRFVEELLFQGTYLLNGQKVTFSADGKVSGLAGYSYYFPQYDYFGGSYGFDQIILGKTKDLQKGQDFAFQFMGNTLKIYDITCTLKDKNSNDCLEAKRGKLRYTLVK
ncbi:hypothetical protein [Flectobacillus major]|jgi:hypothetical protein|uniref:hypothetical protein n=1 Tax=Flectobacillus major TaxID=103 RepID=UPI0003FFC55A|nr:hypothetical protein [Flectobacillus major]